MEFVATVEKSLTNAPMRAHGNHEYVYPVPIAVMAEQCAKRAKRSTAPPRIYAVERAKQFDDDLYVNGDVLFYRFCNHSIDFVRVDTIKNHMKSKKQKQPKRRLAQQGR